MSTSQAEILDPTGTLPTLTGDEPLYEVVNGRRVELSPMGVPSVWISSLLNSFLGPYVRTEKLGVVVAEMLFILNRERNHRRRPDLAFVSVARWPLDRPLPEGPAWDVVPDLAVEVISPTDLYLEVVGKVREYFEAGCRLVWVVIPSERLVYVYMSPSQLRILEAADQLDGGDVLPGFQVQLAGLFPPMAGPGGNVCAD